MADDEESEPGPQAKRRLPRPVMFDDRSRYVDRFGLLLSLSILTVVILSLIDVSEPELNAPARLGSALSSALVALTILLALRASGLAHRWMRLVDILVIGGIVTLVLASFISLAAQLPYRGAPAPLIMVVLAAVAPVVIVRRLIHHRVVTRGTLFGAISAYLLIGVMFYFLFLGTSEFQRLPFFGHPEPTTSFMYFSLSTITTVGYGDLTATTSFGRLLATSEAVMGQVYLVTFVAMIVGLYASNRHSSLLNEEPPSV